MNDGFFDIVELVSKYMTGELTGAEQENLDNWLSLSKIIVNGFMGYRRIYIPETSGVEIH
ncbi:MAG: hypothetical protein ACLTZT_14965 [Butyricimonas faecalis]